MTNRLFIGLDFPRNVIHDLINIRDGICGSPNDLNWESEDKLHVTLKFLGDVGKNIEDLLIQRLENFTFNSIKAEFDKFAFFKRNGRLNILFASLKKMKNWRSSTA